MVVRYGSITITLPLPPSDGNTVVVVAVEADGSNEVVVTLGYGLNTSIVVTPPETTGKVVVV